MVLLDMNVVSERADPRVTCWAEEAAAGQVYLSVISVLEIRLGILRLERRDAEQGAVIRDWLEDDLLSRFAGRILPIDTEVARRIARLHVPHLRPDR